MRTMLINAPAIYVCRLVPVKAVTRGRLVSHWVFYASATCSTGVRPAVPDCIRLWPG